MEKTRINKEYLYLVNYSVGAKKEKFLVSNHCIVPEQVLLTMAEEKINDQIERLYQINGGVTTSRKFKSKLRKESFIEIEDLTNLKTYQIELKFEEDGQIKN